MCAKAEDLVISTIIASYENSEMIQKTKNVFTHSKQDGFLSYNALLWEYATNCPINAVKEFHIIVEHFHILQGLPSMLSC